MLKNALKHIKLVSKHKWMVFKLACRIGIPWRGLVHDLSKFSPTEFGESIKYYTGTHSPIRECRKEKGYSYAWVHHVSKNKHHHEYWIDISKNPRPVLIPYKYTAEMLCDKMAAGITYEGKNWTQESELNYYLKEREGAMIHEVIDKVLLEVFTQVKEQGIKKTYKRKNIKNIYKKYCNEYFQKNISTKTV